MAGLWRFGLRATGDVEEVAMKRLGQTVDELRILENLDDVVGRGLIGHARSGADGREVIAGHIGDSEAVRGGRGDRERESPAAPAGEATSHGVDGSDVESRREEQLEDVRELGFGHSAKRRGNEARRTAADEHEADVSALHPRRNLADAL